MCRTKQKLVCNQSWTWKKYAIVLLAYYTRCQITGFKSFDCLMKQLQITITLIIEYIFNSIIYLCFISLLVTLSIEDILHTDIQNRELQDVNEESSEEEESNEFDESNDGDESNEEDEHCNDSEK